MNEVGDIGGLEEARGAGRAVLNDLWRKLESKVSSAGRYTLSYPASSLERIFDRKASSQPCRNMSCCAVLDHVPFWRVGHGSGNGTGI
jgi:hypothetical protein